MSVRPLFRAPVIVACAIALAVAAGAATLGAKGSEREPCSRCHTLADGDECEGVRVYEEQLPGGGVQWTFEEVAVSEPGCEQCCGRPAVSQNNDPTLPPTVTCPEIEGQGECSLHFRVNADGSKTYWCCADE